MLVLTAVFKSIVSNLRLTRLHSPAINILGLAQLLMILMLRTTIVILVISSVHYCRSLTKVKFSTDKVRPALGSCCRLIVVNHAQKTSKLPYFRLFRPNNQILSALTALY